MSTNEYFDNADYSTLTPKTTARAGDVEAKFDAITTGLDKLPSESLLKRGLLNYATSTGSGNAYLLTLTYAPTTYTDGMEIVFKANHANTGAATINVNSLGVVDLKRQDGTAHSSGDLPINKVVTYRYNSTSGDFEMQNQSSAMVTDTAASAAAALVSENNAAISESNALASASAASSSAADALTSENNAASSAADALTSENNAAASESAAALSAAELPNATTAGANKILATNAAGTGWEYLPLIPAGIICAFVPGYFGNGSNGSFTNVLGAGNTVAQVNAYLNPFNWYVCDGATLNLAASTIFNGASRYLPNLTDDRFIMGDTAVGAQGGSNTMIDHTHTHSMTAADHSHTWTQRGDFAGSSSKAGTGDDGGGGPTYNPSTSASGALAVSGTVGTGSAATSTENRPKYLPTYYIMKVA